MDVNFFDNISSLSKFVESTDSLDLLANVLLFRGQPVADSLLPKIARDDPTKDTTDAERRLLQQLKLQGASLLNHGTDLDYLVAAQHFGLKTRLLDWSRNPLVALWFACTDSTTTGDVYVHALLAESMLDENIYDKDPLAPKATAAFQPRANNARLVAQDGWFTLHRYSKRSKRFVRLEENSRQGGLLCYRILSKSRGEILKSLSRHGINARTIYPDLQGLCHYLNWQHDIGALVGPSVPPPADD